MKSLLDYFAGVRAELAHVKWPTTVQAVGYTALVVVISLIIAALLGGFDYLFTFATEFIIHSF